MRKPTTTINPKKLSFFFTPHLELTSNVKNLCVIQDAVNALNFNLSKQRGVCKDCMRNGCVCFVANF